MKRFRDAGIAAALLALAGCGFHPLNAQRGVDSTVADMSDVKITIADDSKDRLFTTKDTSDLDLSAQARYIQEFHNQLLDRINPDGRPSEPRYELRILVTQTVSGVGIQPDGTTARNDVTVNAVYRLVSVDNGKSLIEGTSTGIGSYPIITNSYATVVGGQDAHKRAFQIVSDDITRRLSLYFERADAETR